jgi:NAD-dependent SIR2 family protein deacetylase
VGIKKLDNLILTKKENIMIFTVAGVSTLNGITKVRFANDLTRVKMLAKHGHTDIELLNLPEAMDKPTICAYLKETDLMQVPHFAEAITTAYDKYNFVKVTTKPVVSMESLVARAEAVELAEQPEGSDKVEV